MTAREDLNRLLGAAYTAEQKGNVAPALAALRDALASDPELQSEAKSRAAEFGSVLSQGRKCHFTSVYQRLLARATEGSHG